MNFQSLSAIGIGFSSAILANLSALVIAQTTAPAVDASIVSLIGNGVTVIVLAWYVVYDVRTRTPSMLSAFAAEQHALRTAFAAEQTAERAAFAREQDETHKHYNTLVEQLRQTFIVEQNATRQSFTLEQAAARTRHDKELADLREMLFENMKSMRNAVHDVKDTAQVLINKKALTDMNAEKTHI